MRIYRNTGTQRGVTLVELAATMAISAAIVVGLWGGVMSIIHYFRDDWVKQEMRRYTLSSLDVIADLVEDATTMKPSRDHATGMDLVVFTFRHMQQGTLLQPHREKGFLLGQVPLLEDYQIPFPNKGWFREHGQRIVELHDFSFKFRKDLPENQFGLSNILQNVNEAMVDVSITLSLTTFRDGYEVTEFVTFHRQIFAPALL